MDITDVIEIRELHDLNKANELLCSKTEYWKCLSVASGKNISGEPCFAYCLGRVPVDTDSDFLV